LSFVDINSQSNIEKLIRAPRPVLKFGMFFASILLFLNQFRTATSISCLDENGMPVNSWVAIKNHNSADYYFYEQTQKTFVKSIYNVNQSTDGAIMKTVGQLYSFKDGEEIDYGIYNDEPPPSSSASSTYAHAKGVLV
jgi:hypothetical protein